MPIMNMAYSNTVECGFATVGTPDMWLLPFLLRATPRLDLTGWSLRSEVNHDSDRALERHTRQTPNATNHATPLHKIIYQGTMRSLAKPPFLRLLAALTAVVLVGCGSDCAKGSCYPSGTYIDPNDALGAASAEICFDGDCTTVEALAGPDDVFNGFNVDTWEEGRSVELRMTVFDANGGVIDSLTETRTTAFSGCACGVLFYGWKNGRLHRTN